MGQKYFYFVFSKYFLGAILFCIFEYTTKKYFAHHFGPASSTLVVVLTNECRLTIDLH